MGTFHGSVKNLMAELKVYGSSRNSIVRIFLPILILFTGFYALGADSLWLVKQRETAMSLWTAKKNDKILIARHQFKPSSKTRRKIKDKTELFRSVENEKRTMLSWVGIKNWSPTSYEWSPTIEGGTLIIKGTYQDGNGQLIGFIEKHTYGNENEWAMQETLSQPILNPKFEMDPELVRSFLTGGFQ